MKHIRIPSRWFRLHEREVVPVLRELSAGRPRPVVYVDGAFYVGAGIGEQLHLDDRICHPEVHESVLRVLNLDVPEARVRVIRVKQAKQ